MGIKGVNFDIIAGFKCPICDSDVKAYGIIWRCARKGCYFRMGRKWKKDPQGQRWIPIRENYQRARENFRSKR